MRPSDYGDHNLCTTCSSNSKGGCSSCISGYFGINLDESNPTYKCEQIKKCHSHEYEVSKPSKNTDRSCSRKKCDCQNGIGTSGTECSRHGSAECKTCNNGYQLTNGLCILKRCECDGGNGATGSECPIHGNFQCEACHTGYHMNRDTSSSIRGAKSCQPNICNCPGGTAVTGATCLEHQSTTCSSCQQSTHYFIATSESCQAKTICQDIGFEFESHPGTSTTNRRCQQVHTCNVDEYIIKPATKTTDNECKLRTKCRSFEYALFAVLLPNQNQMCTKITQCNSQSQIKIQTATTFSNTICRDKICVCPYGEPNQRHSCPLDGNISCASCDNEFYLDCSESSSHCKCKSLTKCTPSEYEYEKPTDVRDRVW